MKKLPKGIRQKSTGKFIVDICVKGTRKTITCDTLEDALKARERLELELKLALISPNTEMQKKSEVLPEKVNEKWTLGQACDYMFATRWKTLRSPQIAITLTNHACNFFGKNKPINEITIKDLDSYANYLQANHKAGTAKAYLQGLSVILNVARDREMIDKTPKFPTIKVRATRLRFLTDMEEKRILEYFHKIGNEVVADIVTVLVDTGMRCGELLSIKPENIDFETNLITLWQTKTDRARSIPMTTRVRDILWKYTEDEYKLKKMRYKQEGLFKISYLALRYHWVKMRDYLGYTDPDFVLHMLRHTCCSRLVQRGAELIKVSKWLGHSNITTTMRYAHLAPNSLIDIKGLLEQ